MSKEKVKDILILYNEKIDKLMNSRFVKFLTSNDLKFSINYTPENEVTVSSNFADQDALDAFGVTIRFFNQNNEPISVCNMSKIYHESGFFSDELKKDFDFARTHLNKNLDKDSNIITASGALKNRDIFDIVLYGGIVHSTRREEYKKLVANPLIAVPVMAEFQNILMYFLHCIVNISKTNEKALKEFERQGI